MALGIASALLAAAAAAASTPLQAATVALTLSPDRVATWAAYDIRYFTVSCTWSDGVPDPDCTRAGAPPRWSTDYGWFEPLPSGVARTAMPVASPTQRSGAASGRSVLWSSDYDVQAGASGTVRVSYGGSSAQAALTIYPATAQPTGTTPPLPCDYAAYAPAKCMTTESVKNWVTNNPLASSAYLQAQRQTADDASKALTDYVRKWLAGQAPAQLPDGLLPASLNGGPLRFKLVKPANFDPTAFWMTRPARFNYDGLKGGAQGLFPDYNATYLRGDFIAPFNAKLVITGQFPKARFMSIQNSPPFDPQYPAGKAFGAPEVPFLDADIEPEEGHTNPFRVGADRNAVHRSYRVVYKLANGNAVRLNERTSPGSMNELNPDGAAYRPTGASSNVRVGAGMRSGGATTDGDLLPGQLWIRYYVPDRAAGPYGGVPLPSVHLELPTGEAFMVVPLRWPEAGGEGRDQAVRRVNVITPVRGTASQEPSATGWTSDRGWLKAFGIARGALIDTALSPNGNDGGIGIGGNNAAASKLLINLIDGRAFGRGPDQGTTGSLENSATGCAYINYIGRLLTVGAGSVAVIVAKAPTVPRTREGLATMPGAQLRYFSITRYAVNDLFNSPSPGQALSSIMDEDLVVPASGANKGWFMLAFSRPEDKPINATAANGVTWVDWGPVTTQKLTVRSMAIGPQWWDANVALGQESFPWVGTDWATRKFDPALLFTNDRRVAKQGDYFFQIHYMTRAQFEALGSAIVAKQLPGRTGW
jgi:hypothetical protein